MARELVSIQDLSNKDFICTGGKLNLDWKLVVQPDGSVQLQDAQGNVKGTVPAPTIDMDITGGTLTGSTLTLVGENGEPDVVVDICAVVAANCDATLAAGATAGTYTHTSNSNTATTFTAFEDAAIDAYVADTLDCSLLGTH